MQDTQARIETEVEELHQFFEDWFLGKLPDSEKSYWRFSAAMGEGFQIVSPTGSISPREGLLAGLRAAHGSRRGSSQPYAIRVRNVAARELGHGLWLATYEEWQDADGLTKGRTSSAVLREDAEAPGGWSWLHVHETWLE